MGDETVLIDPVTLSGGPLGGEVVEWPKASVISRMAVWFGAEDKTALREFDIDGVQYVYRREGDVAVFAGTDQ